MVDHTPATSIGRYQLTAIAGEGATAHVWHGTDALLERDVAVKVLKPAFSADAALVERFFNEARSMAGLSHPAIVPIYDMIADGDRYALVMEYVDGPSLATTLARDGRVEQAAAVALARDVAAALGAAHARGILHRDVKPANILLAPGDLAKVTDFGLAKAWTDGNAARTISNGFVGSAHYASPEQVQGFPLTPQSDLYSLGAVLYHMLIGRPPYDKSTPLATALAHLTEPVPSEAFLARHMAPPLATIVHRLLAKDPTARFASADDVETALKGVVPSAAAGSTAWNAPTIVGTEPALRAPTRSAAPRRARAPNATVLAAVMALVALGLLAEFGIANMRHPVATTPISGTTPIVQAPPPVVVPSMVGWNVARARQQLARLMLRAHITSRWSAAPSNAVVAQWPRPGAHVNENSLVGVIVSSGPLPLALPVAAIVPPAVHGHGRQGHHGHHGRRDD